MPSNTKECASKEYSGNTNDIPKPTGYCGYVCDSDARPVCDCPYGVCYERLRKKAEEEKRNSFQQS